MNHEDHIIQPPTMPILTVCDAIDGMIQTYLNALQHAKLSRRFEAPTEVYSILKLLIRNAEAITVLARKDLIYAPAAAAIARSILEAGYRASWLLAPSDPFEREARWVLYLESAIDHHTRLSKIEKFSDEMKEAHSQAAESYRDFSLEIRELLTNDGYIIPKKHPNFRQLIEEQDFPECYHFYIYFSAATHSNFAAMGWYRKNLGQGKILGEFVDARDWTMSLDATGSVFFLVAQKFLRDNDVDIEKHFPESNLMRFQEVIRKI